MTLQVYLHPKQGTRRYRVFKRKFFKKCHFHFLFLRELCLLLISKDRKLYVHDFEYPTTQFNLSIPLRQFTLCHRSVPATLEIPLLISLYKKSWPFCQVSVLIALLEVITAILPAVIEQHFSLNRTQQHTHPFVLAGFCTFCIFVLSVSIFIFFMEVITPFAFWPLFFIQR